MSTSSIKTGQVFVTGQTPTYTYNPRNELQLEDRLNDYLDDGGDILSLLGPTKTGKTVLLKRVLDNPVWVDGQSIKSPSDLWQVVGSKLRVSFESNETNQSGSTKTVNAQGNFIIASGGGQYSRANAQTTELSYVAALSHQVTEGLLSSGRTLVVDDFHFIERDVQKEIVRAVKPLIHEGLRVVFAAITHRRHDINAAAEDMNGRVKSIQTSVWSDDELAYIATQGFRKLNVIDPEGSISSYLAEMSFGSPHIMQQLCRELVRNVNGIREAQRNPHVLQPPDSWNAFFREQYTDWSSGQWFNILLRGPQEKGKKRTTWTLKNGTTQLDSYGLVLKAIADSGPLLELTRDQIRARIEPIVVNKPPEAHQITRSLQHMSRIAAKRLDDSQPTEDDLDNEAPEFGGVQPVFDFIEDGPAPTAHIADPFFAYFLKWGAADQLTN